MAHCLGMSQFWVQIKMTLVVSLSHQDPWLDPELNFHIIKFHVLSKGPHGSFMFSCFLQTF